MKAISEKFMSAWKFLGLLQKSNPEEKCSATLSNEKLDNLMRAFTMTQLSSMKIATSKWLVFKEFTEDLFPTIDFE